MSKAADPSVDATEGLTVLSDDGQSGIEYRLTSDGGDDTLRLVVSGQPNATDGREYRFEVLFDPTPSQQNSEHPMVVDEWSTLQLSDDTTVNALVAKVVELYGAAGNGDVDEIEERLRDAIEDVRESVARGDLVVAEGVIARFLRSVTSVVYDPEKAEYTVTLSDSETTTNFGTVSIRCPASDWGRSGPGNTMTSSIPLELGRNLFNPAGGDGEKRWRIVRSVLQRSATPASGS